jgi:hypothetical protein
MIHESACSGGQCLAAARQVAALIEVEKQSPSEARCLQKDKSFVW